MKRVIYFCLFLMMALSVTADPAFTPLSFSYHGSLRDNQGMFLPEDQRDLVIEFRLYSESASKNPLWGRAWPVTLNARGLFSVAISDAGEVLEDVANNALFDVLRMNDKPNLYLGLTVRGSKEIAPRQLIHVVPFAQIAATVYKADADFKVKESLSATTTEVQKDITANNSTLQSETVTVNQNAIVLGEQNLTVPLTIEKDLIASTTVKVNRPAEFEGCGIIPIGGIVPYYGDLGACPEGWYVCDGSFGTPDLRARFVLGTRSDLTAGSTGGSERERLSVNQLPRHSHGFSYVNASTRSGSVLGKSNHDDHFWTDQGHGRKGIIGTSSTTGSSNPEAMENRPKYYALYYIMRGK